MKKHELNTLPEMQGDEKIKFLESFKKNGFMKEFPIIVFEGKVLDGWNRQIACEELNIMPGYVSFSGTYEDAIDLIIASVIRRNMNKEQLSYQIGLINNSLKKEVKDGGGDRRSDIFKGAKVAPLKTRNKVAEQFNISPRTVTNNAKAVTIIEAEPIIKEEFAKGKLKLNEAAELAEIIQEEEIEVAEIITDDDYIRNEPELILERAKEIRKERKEVKKVEVKETLKKQKLIISKPIHPDVVTYKALIHDIKDFKTVAEVKIHLESLIKIIEK